MLPPFDPAQEFRKGIRELTGSFSEAASAAVWSSQLLSGSLWVWRLVSISISFNKHIARREINSSEERFGRKRLIKDLVRKDRSLLVFSAGKAPLGRIARFYGDRTIYYGKFA